MLVLPEVVRVRAQRFGEFKRDPLHGNNERKDRSATRSEAEDRFAFGVQVDQLLGGGGVSRKAELRLGVPGLTEGREVARLSNRFA